MILYSLDSLIPFIERIVHERNEFQILGLSSQQKISRSRTIHYSTDLLLPCIKRIVRE